MASGGLRRVVRWAKGLPNRPQRARPAKPKALRAARPARKNSPVRISFKEIAPLNELTLLFPPAKLGLIWSPKCACTKVVLWYFQLTGLLDAALFYHAWPHQYRIHVLYSSQRYGNWMRNADWRSFSWYQFCRDPVKRLLSSYRHNLSFGYADDLISKALGRPVSCLQGYSLNDFLQYLEAQDLAGAADPHVKYQWHRVSKQAHVDIINVDEVDMLQQMNVIERKHGLPITDFSTLAAFKADDRRRARLGQHLKFSPERILTKQDAMGVWPLEAGMLDSATTDRITRLYAPDMRFIYGQDRAASSRQIDTRRAPAPPNPVT